MRNEQQIEEKKDLGRRGKEEEDEKKKEKRNRRRREEEEEEEEEKKKKKKRIRRRFSSFSSDALHLNADEFRGKTNFAPPHHQQQHLPPSAAESVNINKHESTSATASANINNIMLPTTIVYQSRHQPQHQLSLHHHVSDLVTVIIANITPTRQHAIITLQFGTSHHLRYQPPTPNHLPPSCISVDLSVRISYIFSCTMIRISFQLRATRLYTPLCRSVRPSVRPSLGPSFGASVTLYFFWVFVVFGFTAPAQMIW